MAKARRNAAHSAKQHGIPRACFSASEGLMASAAFADSVAMVSSTNVSEGYGLRLRACPRPKTIQLMQLAVGWAFAVERWRYSVICTLGLFVMMRHVIDRRFVAA